MRSMARRRVTNSRDQEVNKSASQATLKAENEEHGSTASVQTTPKASPVSPRRSKSDLPENHAEKGSKPQSKSITYGLNSGGGNSFGEDTEKSSLGSGTSRGSGEALRKIYQLRRKSLSSSSTRSGSTITNVSATLTTRPAVPQRAESSLFLRLSGVRLAGVQPSQRADQESEGE